MPRPGPTIADTALALIRERGPLSLDALVPEIVAAGRTRARNPRAAVRAAIDVDPAFLQARDGRWCSLVDQLDGAIFASPLTSVERRDEIVFVRDHLGLVERLALRERPLVGGGTVHLDFFGDFFDLPWPTPELDEADMYQLLGPELATEMLGFLAELGLPPDVDEEDALRDMVWEMRGVRVLHGPDGWLPALGSRQLLGIRVRAGVLETEALDRRDISGSHVGIAAARVARLARLVIGSEEPMAEPGAIALEDLLELIATDLPELLHRPLPPIAELAERGGLEVREGWVGLPGTDWEATGLLPPIDVVDAWGFEPPSTVH
jgi:hypothetical protein